ncbi:MAG: glycosyltransferase family 2 protein [Planctomycetes bacterium]|nr:glycosyltransferase family 2 protein [Planctomycetota bacterium]
MRELSVVIPNYNGGAYLGPLMESLRAQSLPPAEIWVVDDASTDDSVSLLRSRFPHVRLLINEKNFGFAVTANRGLRAAQCPLVALLNNDTVIDAQWSLEAIRPLEDPSVGSVATRIVFYENPDILDSAGDIYLPGGIALKRGSHRRAEDLPAEGDSVFSACAAAAVYRQDALAQTGLLDECFEAYYEDVDLGFRLQHAGWRCVYAPAAVCCHHVSASYRPASRRFHFLSSRNSEVVFWSNLPAGLLLRCLPEHALLLSAQWLDKMLHGHGLAFLAGKLAFLGRIGLVRTKRKEVRRLSKLTDREIEARMAPRPFRLLLDAYKARRHPLGV